METGRKTSVSLMFEHRRKCLNPREKRRSSPIRVADDRGSVKTPLFYGLPRSVQFSLFPNALRKRIPRKLPRVLSWLGICVLLWALCGLQSPCVAQSPTPVNLSQVLPKHDSVMNRGTITPVSAVVVFPSNKTETIEYTLLLSVNGCTQHPFRATLSPGATGSAKVTWYVCVSDFAFVTTIRLLATNANTSVQYELAEVVNEFSVDSTVAVHCHYRRRGQVFPARWCLIRKE